jgi:phosphatidylglycerol---prolipoprotein diacylglyceryl transferase
MRPILWETDLLGRHLAVKSYTFFLVLAAVAAISLGAWIARKRGLDGRGSAVCLLVGLIATMVGGRLVHLSTNPGSFDGLGSVVSLGRSNLSVYAGLLLGIPAAALCARRLGVNAWRLADSAAPALALAAVLARVGCLLNGCCYGCPTSMAWAIKFPAGSDAHLAQIVSGRIGLFGAPLPVHPTQLYEAAAAAVGGLFALWLLRRKLADGKAFLAFTAWFAAFRWANSRFLATPPSFSAPAWLYPAIYALVLAACLVGYLRLNAPGGCEAGPANVGLTT